MSTVTQFNFPTVIRFGVGAIKELPEYLKSNGLEKPLVVTDPNVGQLEFFKGVLIDLDRRSILYETFDKIDKNPVKSNVLDGGDVYEKAGCDTIIGIGGGAAMDVARAIALRVNNRKDLFVYDDLIGGDKYIDGEIPHFITIPTTSGTGSEVGRSAIISEDESKKKRILFHPTLMARIVFADPELTYELPPAITAATGMDALTHNMEAYLAKNYHPMCDGIALEGVRMISNNLEQAVLNPNPKNRSVMMLASLMGAVAFQKGLGIVHSLAHPLSTLLDVHHGLANAIMIKYGMKFNFEGFEHRFAVLARTMKQEKPEEVLERLEQLNEEISIPANLKEIGVKEEHVDPLSQLAIEDFCHPNNPKPVKLEDFNAIYKEAILNS